MLFPPLGAANIKSQLNILGIEAIIIDCTFMTLRQVRSELIKLKPEIIGIYSMVTLSRSAFKIADIVKSCLPASLLVAGGPLPTLYPGQYASKFDAVFRGESDLSFPRFCQDVLNQGMTIGKLGEMALDSYEGLFIQSDRLNINNPLAHYEERVIKSLPIPDRSNFDHLAYQNAWMKKDESKTTSLITTLGCPYSCDFCSKPVFGNIFRRRNLDTIFEEVEQILSMGYDRLWIADDNFTLNNNHLEGFCQRMLGRRVTWSCLSRSNGISLKTAKLMKEAGCRKVYLGLETGCPETLKLMNKQVELEDGVNAVHLFHDVGIKVGAFFIVGYPGETLSSVDKTFKLSLELPLDEISFNVPYPLPGSNLFDRVNNIDISKDWHIENEVSFIYNSAFNQRWLRRRIRQTMRAFAARKK
jgi:anaerobic magnesium-protoporphyrin IX monomethyl ester cyclase